ncbi:MAG: ketopantoate reductase family protein [Clostridia bacterium]|nr:ketopantoate reductase family protein [Clostridia bacterium]
MKTLVIGVGVIGSYLTHALCAAGNEVTVVARGAWGETIRENGLQLRHRLQHRTTVDRPKVVDSIPEGGCWDVAFVVMSYTQIQAILPLLTRLNAPIMVLVGNNMQAEEMARCLESDSTHPKEVLFGFQISGGKRLADRALIERFGQSGLDVGGLHHTPSETAKNVLKALFSHTGYRLHWQRDMQAYLRCHPAAVLPIAYLAYICGTDLRKSTKKQRKAMIDASREAYARLRTAGIDIEPQNSEWYYGAFLGRVLMHILYFIMAKTQIGEYIACAHCRSGVSEMERLDQDFIALLAGGDHTPMPAWNALRAALPSWEALHETYDRRKV